MQYGWLVVVVVIVVVNISYIGIVVIVAITTPIPIPIPIAPTIILSIHYNNLVFIVFVIIHSVYWYGL